MIRAAGANYFNPDEAAATLIAANPGLEQVKANAAAWRQGKRLLERAIRRATRLRLRDDARWRHDDATAGRRCRSRVRGAHLLRRPCQPRRAPRAGAPSREPAATTFRRTVIRRRWRHSRMNLIRLLPVAHRAAGLRQLGRRRPRRGSRSRAGAGAARRPTVRSSRPTDLTATPHGPSRSWRPP